ncbi:MAG: V-type ATP synthase subunit E family protein [Clostridia bacterium]|nr:V-type ATP synthase subunit E family protein [Clostridia bacterium]
MTGVEKIKDRILEEARRQVKEGVENAEAEAEGIIETARKEAEEKRRALIDKAKAEAENVRKRLLAVAELEARKEKLKARQEIVEEAFARAMQRLCSMPDEQYQAVLADMIINSVETGEEEIILSPSDKSRLKRGFVEDINQRAAAKGLKGNISISQRSADIRGGFILKSGDVEINNSFEVIFRMKRDELEGEVFNLLF